MADIAIVDTNILVSMYDHRDKRKQQLSLKVADRLAAENLGVLTAQVLAEFFIVVTRKISSPLSVRRAYQSVENYVSAWRVLDNTGLIVLEAIRGVAQHQLHFWDAQVWAAAKLNQIRYVLTEDVPSSRRIETVEFVNPFAEDFEVDVWT